MADRRFVPIRRYAGQVDIPERKTAQSAGYDLAAAEETQVDPGKVVLVPTGLKAYMGAGEVLLLALRSSLAVKGGLMMANGVGVIDADYVDNPHNEGHILVAIANLGDHPVRIQRGERIAQGIFLPFLTTNDDRPGGERAGGFGSTGN